MSNSRRQPDACRASDTRDLERDLRRFARRQLRAVRFDWLVMSIPLNQAMLPGENEPATPTELNRYADAVVHAFVAPYRTR
jgi:hypothetical protein